MSTWLSKLVMAGAVLHVAHEGGKFTILTVVDGEVHLATGPTFGDAENELHATIEPRVRKETAA